MIKFAWNILKLNFKNYFFNGKFLRHGIRFYAAHVAAKLHEIHR